ncbi:hypothetical protein BRYFOR_06168 [Marvinbryantia formatexigens DSM 14469]|uniref:Uncharacterized protein n=1 Tax=Marvinbryantia formatexigens DSM 14469 TaxID=478749 RepID=C6LC21_9FIRM|nr:hypothetical protein BRYFOR_06168 [Marvinbryantia formatexigens DSM 14469]
MLFLWSRLCDLLQIVPRSDGYDLQSFFHLGHTMRNTGGQCAGKLQKKREG